MIQNENGNQELLDNIGSVLDLLAKKTAQYPESAILKLLTEKYKQAKLDVAAGTGSAGYLLGGSRAYLDSFSDWANNPLLDAMGKVEKLIKEGKKQL